MKQKIKVLGAFGILSYIVLSFIDRAIIKIPDVIYIPIALLIISILLLANNLKKYIKKK